MTDSRVVKSTKKGRPINFMDYIFKPKNTPSFTALTDRQKTAIKNIEDYWINRVKNYRNWKFQKHWSYRKESLSSRIDTFTFKELKGNNNSKSIQNFVRKFLREPFFRKNFIEKLYEQFEKDPGDPRLSLLEFLDISDSKKLLIDIFPYVVSGEVYVIEKELFTFYFTFLSDFSVSYAIRIGLIHFKKLEDQNPIEFEDVPGIMVSMINK